MVAYGHLTILLQKKHHTTFKQTGSRVEVDPKSICRMVYNCDGVMFFDKDIIEYNNEGVRRIEPIIDDSLMVYVGRHRNNYAFNILPVSELKVKVIGNVIENADLLDVQWDKIAEI